MPLVRVQERERRRHDVRHDARALRAAGHEEVQALSDMIGIGERGGVDDRWPNRIAGHARLRLIDALEARKAAGDKADAGAQKAIGPAHHGVLLMQDSRDSEKPGGEKRRHGRIAAEADHGARLDAPEPEGRRREARAQGERRARLGERASLGGCRGGKGVNGAGGKILAELQRPAVGRKLHLRAALRQRRSERRRGKEMSARAAGREQDRTRRVHPSDAAG